MTVVESGKAPGLLLLGADAIDAFRGVSDQERADVDAWERVARDTAIVDA